MEETENNQCRTCLSYVPDAVSLNMDHSVNNNSMILLDLIKTCTSAKIELNDNFPQYLCWDCIRSAEKAFEFRIQCENADSILRSREMILIKEHNIIKSEVEDQEEYLIYNEDNNYENTEKEKETNCSKFEIIEVFPCISCNLIFTSETLKTHFCNGNNSSKSHQEKKNSEIEISITCVNCKELFTSAEELQSHMENFHNLKNESKSDPNETQLKSTTSSPNSLNLKYTCNICSEESNIFKESKEHILKDHALDPRKLFRYMSYKCECGHKKYTLIDYYQHISQHKMSEINETFPAKCPHEKCGKTFSTRINLKRHLMTHKNKWPKKCEYCEEVINKNTEYKGHLNEKHKDLKNFECKQCGKKYFTRIHLKTHMSTHTGEKKFVCDYCGLAFHAKNNLVSHRRLHEGILSYKCTYCTKAFAQEASLRSHLINHSNERKYKCNLCPATFKRMSNCNSHQKSHLGQKDFECHLCKAKFVTSSVRKKHMLTHTGERNHVCEFCGKAFGRKSQVTVHRKIHTGEKSHFCDICGKGFIQKHVLHSHLQTHKKYEDGEIPCRRKRNITSDKNNENINDSKDHMNPDGSNESISE